MPRERGKHDPEPPPPIGAPIQRTFQEALNDLFNQGFTGAVTFHFLHGKPRELKYASGFRVLLVYPRD